MHALEVSQVGWPPRRVWRAPSFDLVAVGVDDATRAAIEEAYQEARAKGIYKDSGGYA